MRRLTFNFEPEEPEPDEPPKTIPVGKYMVIITGVEHKQGQHQEYLIWKLRPITPDVHHEFRLNLITSLAERHAYRMKELIRGATGLNIEGKVSLDPAVLIGETMEVDVILGHFRDMSRNEVHKIHPKKV